VTNILIRYGETGLKGEPVRYRFEKLLVENMMLAHKNAGVSCLFDRQRGRIFASTDSPDRTMEILSKTFGVVSFSPVEECPAEPEEIARLAVSLASTRLKQGMSFAVRARRTGEHAYSSMQLAALVGERILEATRGLGITVDLDKPDFEIFIEVRNNRAFVFTENIPGPGGLPLRSQGRVLAIIEDRKSLLAAWLMMRRGCTTILVNQSELTPKEIELLKPWNPWWNGFIESTDPLELLRLKNCAGISLGWTLEEFESREKLLPGVPVFYPLIGMTKEEIEGRMASLFG
jgi:thiamine biosynthesis protein ThiI